MKKNLFQKSFAAGLTVCALSWILLGGCGRTQNRDVILYAPSEQAEAENQISLTFFGFKADAMNLTATEAALQSFMSAHSNINITYEGIKGAAYWDAFDKRDAAGVLDDVIMMHHDHVVTMSAEGKLADLSDLPGLENYSDATRGQFVNPDGTVYFLPTSLSTYNLYINYDLLKAHGQNIPENWEEFRSCCDYFAKRGIVPIIANKLNSLPTLIVSRGLYEIYQKPNVDEILRGYNENPLLMAKELAPGVEMAAEMISRGWIDPAETLATGQTSDDLNLFVKGERPFMVSGGWASVRVAAMEPDFTYGVHPYPVLDDGTVLAIQADTCISINAGSKNVEAAKKFVSYLIQPDVMWNFCDSQASYTPLKDDKRTPSDRTLIPSTENLANGRVVLRAEYRLTLPTEAALAECSAVLLEGGSAEEAKAALAAALAQSVTPLQAARY